METVAPNQSAPPNPAATLPPGSNPLAHLAIPFQPVDFAARGVHLDAQVLPEALVGAVLQLDEEGFSLDTITGVDWLAPGQFEVVYDFFRISPGLRVAIRTRVPRDKAELPTISKIFPGANWHEREAHDFFGICFIGHPNMEPFLLPEDATYHPLRKDFKGV